MWGDFRRVVNKDLHRMGEVRRGGVAVVVRWSAGKLGCVFVCVRAFLRVCVCACVCVFVRACTIRGFC